MTLVFLHRIRGWGFIPWIKFSLNPIHTFVHNSLIESILSYFSYLSNVIMFIHLIYKK